MSILAGLLKRIGADESTNTRTKAARIFADTEGVSDGPEFLRIRALPRRRWQDDPQLGELVDAQTARFLRDNPEDPNARLLPHQAVGLAEFELYGRLVAVWGVGAGKTLLSGLLPGVATARLPEGAKRPLLLLPPPLIDKTRKEFKKLSKTWRIHPAIQLFSYNKISGRNYKHFLTEGRFDRIMADESYEIKNPKAGRTVRIGDYCMELGIEFVPMTGTPGDSTVGDYAHYFYWAGRENSPLPEPESYELLQWKQATDETVRELRRAPGCLSQFSGGNHALSEVRKGLGLRMEETPGYVYFRDSSVNCSLQIDAWVHDGYSSEMDDIFAFVRESEDELPDGRVLDTELDLETPLMRNNVFATLNLGFARIIDPKPPEEWRLARKAYNKFVTECLSDRSLGFETAGEVKHALTEGELDSCGIWEAWREIEPTFKKVSKTEWFSDEIVKLIAEWMQDNDALVWTEFPAFGRALSKASGRPFFHHGGISLTHGSIEEYSETHSVVVSRKSNFMGRNLQDRWSRNLIVGSSGKADVLEQQIGRTHRQHQKADLVTATFFVGSIENLEVIDRARGRAEIDRDMGRNKSSKLIVCDWLVPETDEVLRTHKGPRWRK